MVAFGVGVFDCDWFGVGENSPCDCGFLWCIVDFEMIDGYVIDDFTIEVFDREGGIGDCDVFEHWGELLIDEFGECV